MEGGFTVGYETGVLVGVLAGLALFGWYFNRKVGEWEQSGASEGYTWLLVVLGVLVTLSGAAVLIGIENVLYVLPALPFLGQR